MEAVALDCRPAGGGGWQVRASAALQEDEDGGKSNESEEAMSHLPYHPRPARIKTNTSGITWLQHEVQRCRGHVYHRWRVSIIVGPKGHERRIADRRFPFTDDGRQAAIEFIRAAYHEHFPDSPIPG